MGRFDDDPITRRPLIELQPKNLGTEPTVQPILTREPAAPLGPIARLRRRATRALLPAAIALGMIIARPQEREPEISSNVRPLKPPLP